jgi:hypothetical protein
MPRRPPPTHLRLYPATAPLPGRGIPKHPMPSIPCPVFQQASLVGEGPNAQPHPQQRPRLRQRSSSSESITSLNGLSHSNHSSHSLHSSHSSLPPLTIPGRSTHSRTSSFERRSPSTSSIYSASTESLHSSEPRKAHFRGPWDHSASISVQIDVSILLAPLKPAAVNL